jgi:hypothetical protein
MMQTDLSGATAGSIVRKRGSRGPCTRTYRSIVGSNRPTITIDRNHIIRGAYIGGIRINRTRIGRACYGSDLCSQGSLYRQTRKCSTRVRKTDLSGATTGSIVSKRWHRRQSINSSRIGTRFGIINRSKRSARIRQSIVGNQCVRVLRIGGEAR